MRTAVLISGGVDSSVSLALLVKERRPVTAFYLKIWLEDEAAHLGECPWEEDLKFVRAVCGGISVPLKIIPLQKEYHRRVVRYALAEIKAGRTPNPDILCNEQIKFGAFFEAIGSEYERVATGHYAQVVRNQKSVKSKVKEGEDTEVVLLKKSPDRVKDQTYFLSRLLRRQLARAEFPIGGYEKTEVRRLAKEFSLPTQSRAESQGLCFLGDIKYTEFVRHYFGEERGDIIDAPSGKKIGEHRGHWFSTVGQRKGLDLSGGPWYVVGKDAAKNIVYAAHRLKMMTVERDEFEVEQFRFVGDAKESIVKKTGGAHLWSVKIRHGAAEYLCEVKLFGAERVSVRLLDAKERGIAPGQFAVFYDGEYCVGSGVIK